MVDFFTHTWSLFYTCAGLVGEWFKGYCGLWLPGLNTVRLINFFFAKHAQIVQCKWKQRTANSTAEHCGITVFICFKENRRGSFFPRSERLILFSQVLLLLLCFSQNFIQSRNGEKLLKRKLGLGRFRILSVGTTWGRFQGLTFQRELEMLSRNIFESCAESWIVGARYILGFHSVCFLTIRDHEIDA